MTRTKSFFLLSLTAVMLLASMPIFAQTGSAVRVKVPFAFEAANLSMPAGLYTVERSTNHQLLSIVSEEGVRRYLTIASAGSYSDFGDSHLVFEKTATGYQLASLRMPGDGGETMVKKNAKSPVLVGSNNEPERVLIAINLQ